MPFLTIGFFCGLRPENELFHLSWEDVHLNDPNPQITVRAALSKTRERRFPDISANCAAWLRASGVPMLGRIAPSSPSTLKRKRASNLQEAAVSGIKDGMRHTFASNWLALHENVFELTRQLGHNKADTLYRHYHRMTLKADAERYWNILPTA